MKNGMDVVAVLLLLLLLCAIAFGSRQETGVYTDDNVVHDLKMRQHISACDSVLAYQEDTELQEDIKQHCN